MLGVILGALGEDGFWVVVNIYIPIVYEFLWCEYGFMFVLSVLG